MKSITFNKQKYNIPTSWDEITLGMQIKVSQVASKQQYVKTIAILAGYTGIAVEELKTAKVHQLTKVMKALSFIKTPIPDEPVMEFEFNGKKFLIKNNMLEQEFQDYVSIQTAIAEHENNQWNVTPIILAVMCKHGDETLDDFDIMERAKEFEGLPLPIANGIAGFFLSQIKVSNYITMFSSPKVREDILQSKMQELNSTINQLRKQRGGNLLIRLWVLILRKYMKYLNKQLVKSYSSPQSSSLKTKWIRTYKKLVSKMQKVKNIRK